MTRLQLLQSPILAEEHLMDHSFHIEGNKPMKLLLQRYKECSSWRLEKLSGISPEKELDEMSRYVSCFNLEIVEGIWPVK
ncbi:hypothetical protein H5410_058992 [Solanum commersonii]|uniref:Uncharacterized protein n=1 Tax=Solanum commersonii TaxID=4109 RepID=A0A9J5W1A7_SOLCO|nr:hypothetical protein H5410_058992 [Solanum commersonii]